VEVSGLLITSHHPDLDDSCSAVEVKKNLLRLFYVRVIFLKRHGDPAGIYEHDGHFAFTFMFVFSMLVWFFVHLCSPLRPTLTASAIRQVLAFFFAKKPFLHFRCLPFHSSYV
jgi:hypothetical protein